MPRNTHRLHAFVQFVLGSTLLLKGFDKFPHHQVLGGLMILFGVVVLAYFVYTLVKKQQSSLMHVVVHVMEALVSLFTAYIFYEEGRKYVQYGFLLAAVGFLIGAYVGYRKMKTGRH